MKAVAVIGAGAAGCFCAARLSRLNPSCRITLFEAHKKPLAKVAVTGGGRCNLTNTFEGVEDLSRVYPRGASLMKRALRRFGWKDTWAWMQEQGVALVSGVTPRLFSMIAGGIVSPLAFMKEVLESPRYAMIAA